MWAGVPWGRALSASGRRRFPSVCFPAFSLSPSSSQLLVLGYITLTLHGLSLQNSPFPSIYTAQHQANRFATVLNLQPQTFFAMSQPFVQVVEAPVTFKAYLMCAFASFGGIFFGYDSGYING